MATQQELLDQASEICNAEHEGENTAVRVGTMLLDIIEYIGQFMTSTQMETALDQFATSLEEHLAGYATIDKDSGLLDINQAWFVPLATMGALDDSPEEYTPATGEYFYRNQSGYQIFRKNSGGAAGEPAKIGVVYFNKRNGKSYRWDGSAMVELGKDSFKPHVIDYYTVPPFADISVGQSFFYTTQSGVRRLAVKIGTDTTWPFDPDPDGIYVFRDTKKTMIWNSSSRTWDQVGGSDSAPINDLTTGGGDKALSAEMGKRLKQMIDDVEIPMTDTENADLDFQDEDGNVIMRLVGGHIKTKNFNSAEIGSSGGGSTQEISILFVGNSLTQDAVSYLPLVLKELAPDLSFKFYIWYDGGYTLTQILNKWNNGGKAEIFSVCENGTGWTNYNNSKTIASVLSSYTFDVVCLEEYFNYKRSSGYTAEDKQVFNDIIAYIRDHYNKAFKVVSFFHQPLRKAVDGGAYNTIAEQVFELTKAGVQWQLQNTVSESLIPAGIATYRAMDVPSLDSLGQTGHLSPDGTHSQEGLPCLMQAWVVALWIFDHLSLPLSINNAQQRVTSSNYSSINVPGPNLGNGVVVGTTEQDRLAMDVAIKAYKEGKFIELNALTSYTE